MSTIEESIEVAVPVTTAYNQWTQFETFPDFMDGVDEVKQLSDTKTHWRVSVGGVTREFDAEITEQTPDQRVAWRSTEGTGHAGVVTFHKVDDRLTRVMLQLDTEPEGLVEKAGDAIGIPRRDAKADLKNFKQFIEKQGSETGAWRGDVDRES